MADNLRWGILGTGAIAQQFARGLRVLPDARLVAVGSRTAESAERFGHAFDIPRRHADYRALAEDPDVDVIYIATPHTLHAENTLLCLRAGKAVLCEKPFALNAAEAQMMIAEARARRLFLMEAMWMRYLPAMVQVRRWLAEGVIGDVRMVMADFGFRTSFDPQSRLLDPALGGGALLDVGIYPVSLAFMVLGTPQLITGAAHLGVTGVDEQSAWIFAYPQGQLAVLSAAVQTTTPTEARILGTKGAIHIHAPMYRPERLTLTRQGLANFPSRLPAGIKSFGRALGLNRLWRRLRSAGGNDYHFPLHGNGYNYEADEVARCMREGRLESALMPLDETLVIMETLDQLRAQWGLVYPGEAAAG
ncbi:MAG: Gfo/Idh/MocA family oxidoreductase [Anaerolineae bacterium]|jgi:predicted dehydrogenase|nr:Gfo/Idh/MocA family oxidoreductase [Anaerolineae bacterium]